MLLVSMKVLLKSWVIYCTKMILDLLKLVEEIVFIYLFFLSRLLEGSAITGWLWKGWKAYFETSLFWCRLKASLILDVLNRV